MLNSPYSVTGSGRMAWVFWLPAMTTRAPTSSRHVPVLTTMVRHNRLSLIGFWVRWSSTFVLQDEYFVENCVDIDDGFTTAGCFSSLTCPVPDCRAMAIGARSQAARTYLEKFLGELRYGNRIN